MASFFRRLFGGTSAGNETAAGAYEAVEYKGVLIVPAPRRDGGQWRLCGILRESGGEGRERPFVRADMFADADTAAEVAIRKGKLIIDQQGTRLFAAGDTGPV